MTLKQLRYLIAIVEAGSFSSASRRAYIAPVSYTHLTLPTILLV